MQQRLLALIPNLITLLSGVAALLGAGLLAQAPALGLALLLVGQALDILDGFAARRLGVCSEFGARLDWSIDVAVCHVLLVGLGLVWLVPITSALQARSLVYQERVSGRSAVVMLAALHVLGGV